ncbi:MAG: ATP-binding protein [Thermoprotei archaeon]
MERFSNVNPWWYSERWKDRHLAEWESQKVRWRPSWIDEVSLEPFSLNFVYGPRQTGKTTGLKILIKELIERGRDPQSIFYLDLDYVASFREFREILEDYVREKRKRGLNGAVLILDEVTSVRDWWKIVKFYVDQGELLKDVVIVSGSSSLGVVKAVERFPGRTGKGKEVLVLPLSFPEYVRVKNHEPGEALGDPHLIFALFEEYKARGGFPKSINGHPDAEEAVVKGLASEVYKAGKSLRHVQDVLGSVMDKIPSPFSYNAIASDVGVSHLTVQEYLEFLEDVFVLKLAFLKAGNVVQTRREKKAFFRDPFLYRALASWLNREVNEDALLEHVVQEHLYRAFGEVYYFKNDHEIDAIAGGLKVEVKKRRPHRAYHKGVEVLSEEEVPGFLLRLWTGKA